MWANILFALERPPYVTHNTYTYVAHTGWHKSLPIPARNATLSFFFLFALPSSLFRSFHSLWGYSLGLFPFAAMTRIWIIRQMCQVEMLKFPTTRRSLAGSWQAAGNFRFGEKTVVTTHQMIANEWVRGSGNDTHEEARKQGGEETRIRDRMRRLKKFALNASLNL